MSTPSGSALIDEYDTTIVVPPGWRVHIDQVSACAVLERSAPDIHGQANQAAADLSHDAITQQILANALATTADEMAATIFRTAHSPWCATPSTTPTALCTSGGETIAQAVTIPFHLGSVPSAMERLLDRFGDEMQPDDIFIMNDPFEGGIHTLDVFVVKPFHSSGVLIGFAVHRRTSRRRRRPLAGHDGHGHTDISPGRGFLHWVRLYDKGRPSTDLFRVIDANVRIRATRGDLSAQVAACTVGDAASSTWKAATERTGLRICSRA